MFLFSLICFSIVFIFKVKKAIATGKLKWNQGNGTINSNPAVLFPHIYNRSHATMPGNIYHTRSPFDS